MKANEITTLNELAQFINENEDYNVAEVESAIERNGWYVYDTEDDGFVCHDFTDKVELGENGAEVLPFVDEEGHDYYYNGRKVTIRKDIDNYYIDFHTGLDECAYPLMQFNIREALYEQAHLYDEDAQYDTNNDNSTLTVA